MELFKELNDVNETQFTPSLPFGGGGETIPDEQLRARVVSIFKNKGNNNDIFNYRPSSLTNSLYKISTGII